MTMITPSYLGETIEYSSLHACRSTLEDPTDVRGVVQSSAIEINADARWDRQARSGCSCSCDGAARAVQGEDARPLVLQGENCSSGKSRRATRRQNRSHCRRIGECGQAGRVGGLEGVSCSILLVDAREHARRVGLRQA